MLIVTIGLEIQKELEMKKGRHSKKVKISDIMQRMNDLGCRDANPRWSKRHIIAKYGNYITREFFW